MGDDELIDRRDRPDDKDDALGDARARIAELEADVEQRTANYGKLKDMHAAAQIRIANLKETLWEVRCNLINGDWRAQIIDAALNKEPAK